MVAVEPPCRGGPDLECHVDAVTAVEIRPLQIGCGKAARGSM
jgi:hypothetical protein